MGNTLAFVELHVGVGIVKSNCGRTATLSVFPAAWTGTGPDSEDTTTITCCSDITPQLPVIPMILMIPALLPLMLDGPATSLYSARSATAPGPVNQWHSRNFLE